MKHFFSGEKRFDDLETKAVYEAPFYLRYPVTETESVDDMDQPYDAGKPIEECEEWLNSADSQEDSLAGSFMTSMVDEDYGYADEIPEQFRIDMAQGLVKNMGYRFDDEQSGKFYMETTRKLTDEELGIITDYYNEFHYQGLGDMSEAFNCFLGHARTIDVWNTWDDADRQTTFEFSEIPLEEYLAATQAGGDDVDFADAVASIPADVDTLAR